MAKKLTSIEFEETTLAEYKAFAKAHDLTFKALVRLALKEYMERHKETVNEL